MSTFYTLTTITLDGDKIEHVSTELHNIDGKDHNLVTLFSIIMSERFQDIVVYEEDDVQISENGDTLYDHIGEGISHILQRVS